MGMPVIVEIADAGATSDMFDEVFSYFEYVDQKFSPHKDTSEVAAINRGELKVEEQSDDMKAVFALSAETKQMTSGYFDIATADGGCDPSGLVKGWAVFNAAELLKRRGAKSFYVDAGGDIQVSGGNGAGRPWRVGIQNPFSATEEVVKIIYVGSEGVATSGTYIRGQHIYNPNDRKTPIGDIVSLTVVGPNIFEADRFATAAFAMGRAGIVFIERLDGFEGYLIDRNGIATMTSGFNSYTLLPGA